MRSHTGDKSFECQFFGKWFSESELNRSGSNTKEADSSPAESKTEEKLKKGQFSLEDYLSQLRQMKKMGGIEGIMSFLPGVSKIKSQMDSAGIDESIITKNEAIILSMTKKERENPKIIGGSRKKRIANGSGTDPATINKLLKQFKMMSEMMKKMSKGNLKGMSDKGIPPELFNQLK